jgi:hypothetical protein
MLTWKTEELDQKGFTLLDYAGTIGRVYSFVPADGLALFDPAIYLRIVLEQRRLFRSNGIFLLFRIVPNVFVTKREKRQPKQKMVEIEAFCWCVTHSSSSEEMILLLFFFLCTCTAAYCISSSQK